MTGDYPDSDSPMDMDMGMCGRKRAMLFHCTNEVRGWGWLLIDDDISIGLIRCIRLLAPIGMDSPN